MNERDARASAGEPRAVPGKGRAHWTLLLIGVVLLISSALRLQRAESAKQRLRDDVIRSAIQQQKTRELFERLGTVDRVDPAPAAGRPKRQKPGEGR